MKKYSFIPVSALVVASILIISIEIPHFSKMIGFEDLLYLSILLTLGIVMILYITWWGRYIGEDKWVAGGSSVLFTFVIIIGILSLCNRNLSKHNCSTQQYQVINYEPRYSSAYGLTEKEKISPNQWVITINKDNSLVTFTLEKDIMEGDVTNTVNLEFCKGILTTNYLKE